MQELLIILSFEVFQTEQCGDDIITSFIPMNDARLITDTILKFKDPVSKAISSGLISRYFIQLKNTSIYLHQLIRSAMKYEMLLSKLMLKEAKISSQCLDSYKKNIKCKDELEKINGDIDMVVCDMSKVEDDILLYLKTFGLSINDNYIGADKVTVQFQYVNENGQQPISWL